MRIVKNPINIDAIACRSSDVHSTQNMETISSRTTKQQIAKQQNNKTTNIKGNNNVTRVF